MADKVKFDEVTREFLKAAYVDAVQDFGGPGKVTATFNKLFFAKMRGTEALQGFTDNQMRMSLTVQDVYVPTNARVEAKKGGRCKADLVEELNGLLPEPIDGMKLKFSDLETLINALSVKE